MNERHKYDEIRIKNLLGIRVNVDKYKTFEELSNIILDKKILVKKYVDKGVWTNPNCVLLLGKCGFKFIKKNEEKCLYDMECKNEYIGMEFPPQVYYTNKILSLLKKDNYFKKHYCDGIFVKGQYVTIEKRVKNCKSDYGNNKRCDIAVCSIENDKFIIGIEINENQHKNRQTEDKKRCDDLLARYNSDSFKIMKILILKLNKNNEADKKILKEICTDIINNIKKLDSIFDEEKYTINYLVNNGLGDEKFCKMLYHSKIKNKCVDFNDIFMIIEEKIKDEYVNKIEGKFLDWHDNYTEKIQNENKNYEKKFCNMFDDSESENEPENNSENNNSDDSDDSDEINVLRKMCIRKNNVTKLNFDGIVRFLQFLGMHEEFFKNIGDYNYVLKYSNDSSNCMMNAIHELYEMQYDFLHDNKVRCYGDY